MQPAPPNRLARRNMSLLMRTAQAEPTVTPLAAARSDG
ncbi:MAG: hypothetical protein AVDCRST_MAG64-2246 [uncultured Phycisphaerae bacterium]|uniref:Uncharacterized protein n=1 Tax=uncultured Phycisphaerae bacterium TaxID=904963 RepID=A0A6J4PBE0_9BACT|nr:MAG: hypothetical protein AVDCRST_MAG64-2246 [uncultured Phycisphaerae bacterium]